MTAAPRVVPATKGAIEAAAVVLQAGGIVAFPTETVYGLGANALDPAAVGRVFEVKGRPADNPVIVHLPSVEAVGIVARTVPPLARALMARFWPGPLTLVLPKRPELPAVVTAGLDTVAVRMPSHPAALDLLRAAALPVAAPSANRSGGPSPTRAQHVADDLGGAVDLILDGGPCTSGVESTVVLPRADDLLVLRAGALTTETLSGVARVEVADSARGLSMAAPSPGARHEHYAPRCLLTVLDGPPQQAWARAAAWARGRPDARILAVDPPGQAWDAAAPLVVLGPGPDAAARALFEALRALDRDGVDEALAILPPPAGLGLALRDRLLRAAGGRVDRV